MQLKPDSTVPGLWRREPSLVAGVHALIIGISEYPYLEDGSAVVSERLSNSGGLGQLEVCAKTAARFFDLLTSIGEIAGAPITTCRLLLLPRPDEREEVNSLSCNHYASADFEGLRTAIVNWGDDLYAGGRTTEPNVALFFFLRPWCRTHRFARHPSKRHFQAKRRGRRGQSRFRRRVPISGCKDLRHRPSPFFRRCVPRCADHCAAAQHRGRGSA